MKRAIYLLLIVMPFFSIQAKEKEESSFTLSVSPLTSEKQLIGKWVFSEAWSMHMGLALEISADHTFKYWFKSDIQNNIKYPLIGTWKIVKGTLQLSSQNGRLYANELVLARYNGVEGLFDPKNIKVLVWHNAKPDSRFIKKLSREPAKWPIYNYIDLKNLPKTDNKRK